ncbi:DNA-binding transcriptional LysR family regulator [Massilia sp. UYP11]|uniref:LysR family transcriptional regulator n=1 Tax=Massilia sp. UYP11 TaxID=1756385 RepID=UPI003D1D8ABD
MQISDVRIFLAVAAGGTLSAAARQLGIGPMQASRRIAALEADLGVRLFHRTTRSLALTAEGETFAPYAATLAEAEGSARGALRPSGMRASGLLRLTAPSVFGQAIVLPLLPSLLERHPDLRVDLDLSDRVQDIVGQGLDLALRVATLGDSELVARRLAANPRLLCAAPRYLRAHGTPATLADLERHQCIGLHAVARWPFVVDASLQRRRVDARVLTSSVDAARTAAVQGLGLAMLTFWDVHEHLRAGSLVRVELEDATMEELSVWAMTPTRRYVPERVKVFLDALEEELTRLGG